MTQSGDGAPVGLDIPKAVLLAWGAEPTTAKGPRPRWTLNQLLDAAVRLGDEHGVEAISMSGVAKAVGSGTMSLYRYVESREDLLILAADHALGRPSAPEGETWRERLRSWVLELRSAYERHPWLTAVPVGTEALLPSYIRRLETGLACLEPLELSGARPVTVLTLLWTYTRGDVEQAMHLAAETNDAQGGDVNQMLAARLRAISNPDSVARVLGILEAEERRAAPSGDDGDGEFLAAIDMILSGIDSAQ